MTIDNFTQLYQLLKPRNVLPDFLRAVEDYHAECSCKPAEKEQKLKKCNIKYANSIPFLCQNKNILFSLTKDYVIDFYCNGQRTASVRK